MYGYTSEELTSLSDIFLKSQFATQYFYCEIGRQEAFEAKGGVVDGLARRRLVYLGDLHLGFTWELFNYFNRKKDQDLLSRLKSTKEQRSRLKAIRNSIFHVTSAEITNKRFREFKSLNRDWKLVLIQDWEIIGNYIYELHQVRNSANAHIFKDYWKKVFPFR